MAEVITTTHHSESQAIQQCDIFRRIGYIEYFMENGDSIEVSRIVFPLAIVLTQACDLQQDFDAHEKIANKIETNHDKFLISVIVAPIYNFEDFRTGTHLSQLDLRMSSQGSRKKSLCQNIIKNENKRYHYLNFGSDVNLPESVIDFKHYFSVNIKYLRNYYKEKYICSIDSLYKELILQRFSNFLGRIGLPDSEQAL